MYGWLHSHFEWIFVMYISVRMTTISFWMNFRHIHFCTNDCHFFLSGLLSCTFLYEWLPTFFEWILVIYISVRMTTISFLVDCCHAHFCTDDYHLFLNWFSSCIFLCNDFPSLCNGIFVMHFLCKWLSIFLYMDFRHAYSVQWLSIFFWFSMMCAKLFNGWIAWSSDEL